MTFRSGSHREPDSIALNAALVFGVWTALSQLMVMSGGSLRLLLLLAGMVAVVALASWIARRTRRSKATASLDPRPEADTRERIPRENRTTLRWLAPALPFLLLLAGGWLGWRVELLWGLTLLTGLGAFLPRLVAPRTTSDPATPLEFALLLIVAAACALLTLFSHYSSLDDAFYVNVALHVAQEPHAPLLARDTIFGIEGMPLQLPIYKLHSVEVLGGAISYLTGMRAILAMHWVIATIAAFLVPLAQARLFRRLLPDHWLGATLLSCMVIFAWGGENIAVGNFGFVHLYQGKAIFTVLFVPLLLAESLDFAARPSRSGWLHLLFLQIGAVGMTWMALALAPFLTVVGLVAGLRRENWRGVLLGAATCLYAVVAGLIVRGAVHSNPVDWESVDDAGQIMWGALHSVIGHGPWLVLVVMMSLLAWVSVRGREARRLVLLLPLAFLLSFFNPWLVARVAEELGNHSVYARVFWAWPLPLFVALGFYLPTRWWQPRRRWWADLAILAVATLAVHWAMPQHTLSRANLTRMERPREKVPPRDYEMARLLVENTPPGKTVLAPPEIAAWVTTFEHHPPVLFSRHNYYPFLEWQVGKPEAQRRRIWSRSAEGLGRLSIPDMRTMVTNYDLGAICIKVPEGKPKGPLAVLRVLGFEMVGRQRPYSIWKIDKPLPPPRANRRRQ